jgi:hypothetical protein
MSQSKRSVVPLREPEPVTGNRVGAVVAYAAGRLSVDYAANPFGPLPALSVLSLSEAEAQALAARKATVVLGFIDGRPEQPIILGVVQERPAVAISKRDTRSDDGTRSATVDGERVVLEAKERIELRCGKASITLTKDGKVVIRGSHVSSRSTGSNRIRGGSVEIN